VNFVFPYSVLKSANVGGTLEVLRLACQVKTKVVFHIPPFDVLGISHSQALSWNFDIPEHPPRMPFSYPQKQVDRGKAGGRRARAGIAR